MVERVTTRRHLFLEKIERIPESGRWIWMGANNGRYGSLRISGRLVYAHRYSYLEFVGAIDGDQHVCHRCDVGLCANPDHLFLSDHAGNMRDMATKGRVWNVAGQLHARAKLTADDVRAIRESTADATLTAQRFGVSKCHIHNIRADRCWPATSLEWHEREAHRVPAKYRVSAAGRSDGG